MDEKSIAQQTASAEQPRRTSFTQRLLGNSKDLFTGFYTSHDNDDQAFGHGFNDQADDMLPAFIENNANRRRHSSMSSDSVVDGAEGLQRKSSISDRVLGMQLMQKPADPKAQRNMFEDHFGVFN